MKRRKYPKYNLGKETMNEVRLTPKRMQEDKQRVIWLCKICQAVSITTTVSSWPLFFGIRYNSLIWPTVVIMQMMVLQKLLECAINKITSENKYLKEEIKPIPKIKCIGIFVFGASVLFLLLEIMRLHQPVNVYIFLNTAMHIVVIAIMAQTVYKLSEMPRIFTV